jgi:hypothetical protein
LFERIPQRHGPSDAPVASFSFYRSIVAFDHVLQRLVLIADAEPGRRAAYEDAQAVLDGLESDLRQMRPVGLGVRPGPGSNGTRARSSETARPTARR